MNPPSAHKRSAFFQGETKMAKTVCHVCGKGELIQDTRDMPYAYKGRKTVLKDISGSGAPRAVRYFYTTSRSTITWRRQGRSKKKSMGPWMALSTPSPRLR
jgi:YgiT-type zinc finger domain-containing protein